MKEERYIAAIEIGSFKITGSVGLFNPETGTLKVMALEQTSSNDSVRYGIIQNPEEVALRVARIVEKLENNPAVAPNSIKGAFVGLSGRSMHSIPSKVEISFPEMEEITGEMLHNLKEDAKRFELPSGYEIFDTVPRSYQVDGLETMSPKGALGKSITASFDIIVGRSELKRNIMRSLTERTNLDVKGLVVTPLAAASVVLSDEEKRLGCMLVDFGAETTSVSIFQKGSLCYFATIPLGGRHITRDLTTLNILEEKAEEIKIESGRAVASETPSALNINGLKLTDVSNLVVARAEEIVANVIQQIFYAGLKEKDLPAGIVCIGGAANLNGIIDLISNQSSLNARRGNLLPSIVPAEQRMKRLDAIQSAAILYAGAMSGVDDCLEAPAPINENYRIDDDTDDTPTGGDRKDNANERKSNLFSRIGSRISNLFNAPVDETELE